MFGNLRTLQLRAACGLWEDISHMTKDAQQSESLVRELFELAGISIGGSAPGDIVIHDSRFYQRLLRDASIGLGESYMDGWWDTQSLDGSMAREVVRANLKQKITGSWRLKILTAKALVLNLQSQSRSGKSVEARYNGGNDVYTRMLDPRMVYTCGYWKNAKTLAEAQEAKLDLVCRKAGLQPGMRVLESGLWLGWTGRVCRREVRLLGCGSHAVQKSAAGWEAAVEGPAGQYAAVRLPQCDRAL